MALGCVVRRLPALPGPSRGQSGTALTFRDRDRPERSPSRAARGRVLVSAGRWRTGVTPRGTPSGPHAGILTSRTCPGPPPRLEFSNLMLTDTALRKRDAVSWLSIPSTRSVRTENVPWALHFASKNSHKGSLVADDPVSPARVEVAAHHAGPVLPVLHRRARFLDAFRSVSVIHVLVHSLCLASPADLRDRYFPFLDLWCCCTSGLIPPAP